MHGPPSSHWLAEVQSWKEALWLAHAEGVRQAATSLPDELAVTQQYSPLGQSEVQVAARLAQPASPASPASAAQIPPSPGPASA